jgi:hypothetical protein
MIRETETELPPPDALEARCRALAALDACIESEWQYRYHSFDQAWDESAGERMASMRTGSGSRWHLVFRPAGSAGKWFSPDAPSDPSMADLVPSSVKDIVTEPSFVASETGGVLWWDGGGWQLAAASDAALDEWKRRSLLLKGDDGDYATWASGYFEREIPAQTVVRFFAGEASHADVVSLATGWDDVEALLDELREMGFSTR